MYKVVRKIVRKVKRVIHKRKLTRKHKRVIRINPKTVKKYKRFHGRIPDGYAKVMVPDLKQLVFLGKAIGIKYISDKKPFNKPTKYQHKFGSNVNMFTDKTGKALIILGTQFRVTDWLRG